MLKVADLVLEVAIAVPAHQYRVTEAAITQAQQYRATTVTDQ